MRHFTSSCSISVLEAAPVFALNQEALHTMLDMVSLFPDNLKSLIARQMQNQQPTGHADWTSPDQD